MTREEQFKVYEEVVLFIVGKAAEYEMTGEDMFLLLIASTSYLLGDMHEGMIVIYCQKLLEAYKRKQQLDDTQTDSVH